MLLGDSTPEAMFVNEKSLMTHMKMIYRAVEEEVQKQKVSIDHNNTNFMIADPVTKGLPPKILNEHVERMSIIGVDVKILC